jgi:phosphoserine phosphatase
VWIARKHRFARGEIDHNQLAVEANEDYARELAGWSLQQAAPLVQQFVADVDRLRVFAWTAPVLRSLVADGVRPVVVSGAPHEILVEHAERLGLAGVEVHGLTLRAGPDGRFTGDLAANLGTDAGKRDLLQHVSGPVVLGVGDSVSDLPLLQGARRQLVVGRHAQELLDVLGASATAVPDPGAATAEEMIDLVRRLLTS